jgi:hypothetical protein
VNSLWNLSRRNRQIEIDGKKLDRQQVQSELAARIGEISTPNEKPGYTKAVSNWEKTKHHLMGARAFLRRVEFWVDAMDSGKPDGAFRRYIWNPVSEGATATAWPSAACSSATSSREAGRDRDEVRHIESKELGYEFKGKAEVLGALLHTGNESNLQKLLRGRGWGEFTKRARSIARAGIRSSRAW